ncbi:MAG: serine/threonine protein kinase [Myxococcota bacterium]|nr:serine/threonine protein kinase [Myxococcota bacterium]
MPFAPGTILAGKYRVERLLGEGGMGWVVVATHVQLEQRVAVKFMHAAHGGDGSEAIARFLREARAAARIQSEHVARVSDFGTLENGAPYLVMEYLEGEDLESVLRKEGALSPEVVVDYAIQACEGLAEAHSAGIVHRDLKPANLFLARRIDGSVRVKLLDFGISKLAAPGGMAEIAMTSTQALMGSPLYMAPEQMRSSKNVDTRADIWSMGVILYEMLGGRPPFDGETLPAVCARIMTESPAPLRTVQPGVPPALDAVVMRCLEREPRQRFQDVPALARALGQFGTAEARGVANRIDRIARARGLSLPEIASDGSAPGHLVDDPLLLSSAAASPLTSAAGRGVVQTRATFSHTGQSLQGRARPLAVSLLIGGAALCIVTAAGIGWVTTRGPSKLEPRMAASPPPVAAAPAILSTSSATVILTPTPISVPTATATPAPAPTASELRNTPPSSRLRSLPAPAALRPQLQTKPGASAPKPASTIGFGGRD